MMRDANIPNKEDIPAVVDLVFDVEITQPAWTLPILASLQRQELPEDELVGRQIVRREKSYSVINNELFRNSISGVQ